MDKKYKLTDETINIDGHILHRIKALRDFGNVRKGDLGGYIESEDNLLHDGNCWVEDYAKVYDKAVVMDNAIVSNNAMVYDNAWVRDNARIYNNVKVYGCAIVREKAMLFNNSEVGGYASICGNTQLYDEVKVYDKVKVLGCEELYMRGETRIVGDAVIYSMNDYIVFKNWWSSGRFFTWTRSNDMWTVGCFYGTGKELIKKAYNDSKISGREYERIVNYVESIK